MLERETFVIRRAAGRRRCVSYAIADRDGEPLGRAVEVAGAWTALFRRLVGRQVLPTRIELRESLDDSLLAVIHHGGSVVRPRVDVRDSQGQPVGGFDLNSADEGFTIENSDGECIARADRRRCPCRFTTPDLATDLGSTAIEVDRLVVHTSGELADQPLTRLLLLSASLWLDVIHQI